MVQIGNVICRLQLSNKTADIYLAWHSSRHLSNLQRQAGICFRFLFGYYDNNRVGENKIQCLQKLARGDSQLIGHSTHGPLEKRKARDEN